MADKNDLLLGSWGSPRFNTRVVCTEFRGRRFVDVRKYANENPTRKGIMLAQSQLEEFFQVLMEGVDTLEQWFGVEDGRLEKSLNDLDARIEARREEESLRLNPMDAKTRAEIRGGLFRLEVKGGETEIILNENHPFLRALQEAVAEGDSTRGLQLVARMLQAGFQAAALAAGGSQADLEVGESFADYLGAILRTSEQWP